MWRQGELAAPVFVRPPSIPPSRWAAVALTGALTGALEEGDGAEAAVALAGALTGAVGSEEGGGAEAAVALAGALTGAVGSEEGGGAGAAVTLAGALAVSPGDGWVGEEYPVGLLPVMARAPAEARGRGRLGPA